MKTYKDIYRPKLDTNFCCSQCVNAVGGCAWSKSFQPVPGWKIRRTINRDNSEGIKILYCPEFEEGDPLDNREADINGIMRFGCALFELAASDYKAAIKAQAKGARDSETSRTITECELLFGKHAGRLKRTALKELAEGGIG